jgi:hypothetical protein
MMPLLLAVLDPKSAATRIGPGTEAAFKKLIEAVGMLSVEVGLYAASYRNLATETVSSQESTLAQLHEERARLDEVDQRVMACEEELAKQKEHLVQLASCAPVVEDRCIVLKGLSREQVEHVKKGDLSTVGGASVSGRGGGSMVSGSYLRCWQGKGRSDWNVVLEVSMAERSMFLREAKALRRGGVVVAPYLTPLGCKLRKERQGVFNDLVAKGVSPRWRDGVEIEWMEQGAWMKYDFANFG